MSRLRSCEAAYNLMKNYQAGLQKEAEWIDDAYSKLQTVMPTEIKPKEQLDQTRVSFLFIFLVYKCINHILFQKCTAVVENVMPKVF